MLDISRAACDLSGTAAEVLRAGSMQSLIEGGPEALKVVRDLVDAAEAGRSDSSRVLADLPLMAPIPRPRKNVFCVGRNYAEHIAEGDRAQN